MGFYRRIKYYLVHTLSFTNKRAQQLIDEECVEIDGKIIRENCILDDHSAIGINGKIVREQKNFVYLLFNKPAGYQSSLNPQVENNLSGFFAEFSGLSIAGRLDLASEGLLIISNDGKWVEQLCNPKFEKEKEYEIMLDKIPAAHFFEAFRSGVQLGTGMTRPCQCTGLGGTKIKVILTEGKNRQIRRMCHKLGYTVVQLKRVRIFNFSLEDLEPGCFRPFNP